jgi:hypothetical protein
MARWRSTRLSCRCNPLYDDSGGGDVTQASHSMDYSFVGLNGSEVQNIKPQSESAFHNFFPIILLFEPPNQGPVHLCSVLAPFSMKMNLNGVQTTQKIRNFTARSSFPCISEWR